MNHPENIANLFFRSMRNELTGKEKRQLSAWRQAAPANEQLFVFETDPENLRQAMIRTVESKERVFKKLQRMHPSLKRVSARQRPSRIVRMARIAATSVFLICVTLYMIVLVPTRGRQAGKWDPSKPAMIMPDGTLTAIDDGTRGWLVGWAGIDLHKNHNGFLTYELKNHKKAPANKSYGIYRGNSEPFMMLFPDGSRIWVNKMTTIRFPANLGYDTLHLTIGGEFYADFAANSKKKYLITIPSTINRQPSTHLLVANAQLNVSAYKTDSVIRISVQKGDVYLLEDSLSNRSVSMLHLLPGQQAQLNPQLTVVPFTDFKKITEWNEW